MIKKLLWIFSSFIIIATGIYNF